MHWSLQLGLGALAGAGVTWLVWRWASVKLDKQLTAGAEQLVAQMSAGEAEFEQRLARGRQELTRQVQREVEARVPQAVSNTIVQTLARYNITPETGRQIDEAFRLAEQAGVF